MAAVIMTRTKQNIKESIYFDKPAEAIKFTNEIFDSDHDNLIQINGREFWTFMLMFIADESVWQDLVEDGLNTPEDYDPSRRYPGPGFYRNVGTHFELFNLGTKMIDDDGELLEIVLDNKPISEANTLN